MESFRFSTPEAAHRREAVLTALTSQGFDGCVHDAAQAGMPGDVAYGRDFCVSRKPAVPNLIVTG
jgi:hypothetical protein